MSKLQEMFEPGWYKVLESHLGSPAFREIGQSLHKLAKNGTRITPRFSDTFRAFKECPWDKLHTVILGQSPYPGVVDNINYVADGLAFSSRASKTCPVSLMHIIRALDKDFAAGLGWDFDSYDLSRWANQGILLLNSSLSMPVGGSDTAHINLWHPFITYVLKTINQYKDGVAFGLMGSYAKAYKNLLTNSTFAVYTCEHPAAVAHRGKGGKWEDNGVFKAIDGFQRFTNNIKIDWC